MTNKNWITTTLGECTIINDRTYRPSEQWPFVNYLETGQITDNRISGIHHYNTSEDKIPASARRKVRPGDIVYSTVRPNKNHFGRIKDIPNNFLVSTAFAVIRGEPSLADTSYIYYYITQKNIIEYFHTLAEHSSSAYPSLQMRDLEELQILLPPIKQQQSIAHILETFNNKIHLNQQMSRALEEMAKALFKSWFVDFDPVRAKIEGRWQSGQSLPGLPADLYDLFPNRLKSSELGEIPTGWQIKPLGEIFDITMGQSPPGNTYNDIGEGLPFFQGRKDFGFRYPVNRKFCSSPNRVANPEDTLVSVRAPVGDINMAWETSCIGRGVAALCHKLGYSHFTYYNTWALQYQLYQYEYTGTVFGSINKSQLNELTTLAIPLELVSKFEEMVKPFDNKIRSCMRDTQVLSELRDALLPNLLSGNIQIDVHPD